MTQPPSRRAAGHTTSHPGTVSLTPPPGTYSSIELRISPADESVWLFADDLGRRRLSPRRGNESSMVACHRVAGEFMLTIEHFIGSRHDPVTHDLTLDPGSFTITGAKLLHDWAADALLAWAEAPRG